jgi:uncharacterized protein
MKNKIIALSVCLLLCITTLIAQVLPEKPTTLVNDYAHLLSANEVISLEQKLKAYNDSTSTQIAIAIIETLDGNERADYTIKLANKWGIGQKDKRNGLLIMVAKQERKMFVATGYGVEAKLPDAIIKRIEQRYMVPAFKGGNYYQGLNDGTDAMMQFLSGEFKAMPKDGKPSDTMTIIFILLIVIVVIVLIKKGGGNNNRGSGFLNNSGPYIPFIGWGNFSSGGSNWGSGDSGGFGGFGGGSFGGGGAGGDW